MALVSEEVLNAGGKAITSNWASLYFDDSYSHTNWPNVHILKFKIAVSAHLQQSKAVMKPSHYTDTSSKHNPVQHKQIN